MIDEIYDRGYQAGRADLHHGIDRLVHRIGEAIAPALDAIYHIEWDAPWKMGPNDRAKA